jgi:hypothetical protein
VKPSPEQILKTGQALVNLIPGLTNSQSLGFVRGIRIAMSKAPFLVSFGQTSEPCPIVRHGLVTAKLPLKTLNEEISVMFSQDDGVWLWHNGKWSEV